MSSFNYERAAAVLVDAAYANDDEAARKHGVSVRSIRRWRKRLDKDPDLAASVHQKNKAATADWADDIGDAIRSSIDFLKRAAQESNPADPEAVHAIAGAAKLLSEMEMTRRVLDARLANQNRPQPQPAGEVAAHRRRREPVA